MLDLARLLRIVCATTLLAGILAGVPGIAQDATSTAPQSAGRSEQENVANAKDGAAETDGTTNDAEVANQGRATEIAAIRAESQAFAAAFDARDAEAIAALWTADGEYIDDVGRRFVGREAIQNGYRSFFANSPPMKLRVIIDSIRLLSDATAIEDGRAVLEPPPEGIPGFSRYTAVHVKVDGKWRMASVRDTHIETPSAFRNVADLEWLIGTWIAEEHGVTTESTCRWIANKSFVTRTYTLTAVDGTKTSGLQLIGWNPLDGNIQSWNFSPDGGHAVGVWSPTDNGWMAEIRGVTGEGALTTSVNTLTRLDDNAYVWQSVRRTSDDATLPDTEEVVLKRQ